MEMDLIYILGTGSKWENNEIRYSLRSVEKHVKGLDRVFIIGELPVFLQPSDKLIHIHCADSSQDKAVNIMRKLKVACMDERISERFMFFNDDYFMFKNIEIESYPYYHKCDLDLTEKINLSAYHYHVVSTNNLLKSKGLRNMNFDIHKPIIYEKKLLNDIIDGTNWNLPIGEGHIMRSLYCNTLGIVGSYKKDNKQVRPLSLNDWQQLIINDDVDCLSIEDRACTDSFHAFMQYSFPTQSPFERL